MHLSVTYTEGTTSVFDTHIDTQAYGHCPVSAAPSPVTRLSSCVTDLPHSFASLRLQLNPSKTEFIWFGTHHSLAKLPSECRSLTVCTSAFQCADVVRDLGVLLDSELSMQRHISKVVSACFYHLRRLRQIQNCVSSRRHGAARHVTRHLTSRLL